MERGIGIAILGLCILLVTGIADIISSDRKFIGDGILVEKVYSPAETHTGVGYGSSSNGNGGIVVTTSSKSEEYILFINVNGEIIKAKTKMKEYVETQKNDGIKVYEDVGGITGITWGYFASR